MTSGIRFKGTRSLAIVSRPSIVLGGHITSLLGWGEDLILRFDCPFQDDGPIDHGRENEQRKPRGFKGRSQG
jgi:hypothetical protein